ncbi:MAG: CapA family protein [Alphaproteobacteria bacterium]|nr:CapA family protein [Alphaproteobacteria bacterium]
MILASFALLLALSPARAQDPGPLPQPMSLAAADLETGRAMLAEKNADGAVMVLQKCTQRDGPADVVLDCRWELGWARWLQGDWKGVVDAWTPVEKADPGREGLDTYLSQARDNLGMQAMLERARQSAPTTFVSSAPEGATLRMRAVGDCMIGTDFPSGQLPPDNGAGAFGDVVALLQDADLTFGNLEGPICDGGATSKCGADAKPGSCYAFRQPAAYAAHYKAAGFDVMSTANNHAGDFGSFCRERTEQLLDAQGIAHSGRPGDIASLEINGLKVAVIGFHSSRNSHYINDHETAKALVADLASRHDIVVVSFHGGAEGSKAIHTPDGPEKYYGENRGHLRRFTHDVIDAGADLVIGHGPHVLRGMEIYNDRLIAYSLGNFATYGPFNTSGYGGVSVILDVTMDRQGRFVAGKLLPTKQIGEGVPMRDTEAQGVDLVRQLSAEDFPKWGVGVAQDGSLGKR